MTREDIRNLFADATTEQIKALLDINSADIGKAKESMQKDLDAANAALKTANDTIESLKAEDVDGMKKKIADYEKADEDRRQAEKAAQERAELEERFNAASGDRKYIHEMVREGVMNDFGKALQDKANRGKSDREIFDALTQDKGYFASMNPDKGSMGGIGDVAPDDNAKLSDAEYYAKIFADKK